MGHGASNSKSEKRFDDMMIRRASEIPGPGQYDPKTDQNSSGSYFLEKFKNSQAPVFPRQTRLVTLDPSETRKITPGPGTYRAPSEFGYYEISAGANLLGSNTSLLAPTKSMSTSKSAMGLYKAAAVAVIENKAP